MPRIWGLDADRLLDLVWQQQGIVVVRRGCHQPIDILAQRFLLLENDELVLFTLPSHIDSKLADSLSIIPYVGPLTCWKTQARTTRPTWSSTEPRFSSKYDLEFRHVEADDP